MVPYADSQIWPPEMAFFLALWVWEGTGAIQDAKYLNGNNSEVHNDNNSEGMTLIWKE